MAQKEEAGVRPPIRHILAANIFRIRTALGWSQERLGRETGLSRETIRLVEAGRRGGERDLYLDTLERIAMAMMVEPSELLVWDPEDTRVYLPGNRSRPSVIPGGGDSGRKTYIDSPLLVARG